MQICLSNVNQVWILIIKQKWRVALKNSMGVFHTKRCWQRRTRHPLCVHTVRNTFAAAAVWKDITSVSIQLKACLFHARNVMLCSLGGFSSEHMSESTEGVIKNSRVRNVMWYLQEHAIWKFTWGSTQAKDLFHAKIAVQRFAPRPIWTDTGWSTVASDPTSVPCAALTSTSPATLFHTLGNTLVKDHSPAWSVMQPLPRWHTCTDTWPNTLGRSPTCAVNAAQPLWRTVLWKNTCKGTEGEQSPAVLVVKKAKNRLLRKFPVVSNRDACQASLVDQSWIWIQADAQLNWDCVRQPLWDYWKAAYRFTLDFQQVVKNFYKKEWW